MASKRHALYLPCITLLRDGRYLDLLNDAPLIMPLFSNLHECDQVVKSTNRAGFWCQWKDMADGFKLDMKALVVI